MEELGPSGFRLFGANADSLAWAVAARNAARVEIAKPANRAANLRHGDTWYVGVDALPNAPDGSVGGVVLAGPWDTLLTCKRDLHRAQVSVIYPGYPQKDADETAGNHRYRVLRKAAHVDGLLPVGADKRRHAQEFHAWILGIQLGDCLAAPTVCWPGSHEIMGAALRQAIGSRDPETVDVTQIYQEARREVFDRCDMVRLEVKPGESFLLHRFLLHGTDVWGDVEDAPEGRMMAFFRPECDSPQDWLAPD